MARVVSLCFILFIFVLSSVARAEVREESRIIGGSNVSQAPSWMVSLQYGFQHFCGGTLIGRYWVLTAAHCLKNVTPTQLDVVVGARNRNSLSATAADHIAERHQAEWFYTHPDYNGDNFLNDIAIIKLESPSSLQPIALATPELTDVLHSLPQLTAYGWGVTQAGDFNLPEILQKVDVSFKSDERCQVVYRENESYWDHFICAGEEEGGRDSCQGDSGGPLIKRINDQDALVGIVSWGEGCAQRKKYGVYTEVSAYLDWIEQRRRGVTVLGETSMGFVGEGLTKTRSYRMLNHADSDLPLVPRGFDGDHNNIFSLQLSSSMLRTTQSVAPAKSNCEVNVSATGTTVGEFEAKMKFDVTNSTTYEIVQPVSTRVLAARTADALDTQWLWYGSDWNTVEDSGVNETVMVTGDAVIAENRDGRVSSAKDPILMTYVDGPGTLKFDVKVSTNISNGRTDMLVMEVNDRETDAKVLYGERDWNQYSLQLDEGANEVVFSYIDNVETSTSDQVRLNQLRICDETDNCSSSQGLSFGNRTNGTASCESLSYNDTPLAYVDQDGVLHSDSVLKAKQTGGGRLTLLFVTLLGLVITLRKPSKFRYFV